MAIDDQNLQGSVTPESEPMNVKVDSGMVGVNIGLSGLAGAAAAWLDSLDSLVYLGDWGPWFVGMAIFLAELVAILSAYNALRMLARYCLTQGISALLKETDLGPFWLLAVGLLIWFILTLLLFLLTAIPHS